LKQAIVQTLLLILKISRRSEKSPIDCILQLNNDRFTKDTITTHFLDEKADVRHTFVIDKHTTKCPTGLSTKATVDNNAAGGL
jgi:hypothetical protein